MVDVSLPLLLVLLLSLSLLSLGAKWTLSICPNPPGRFIQAHVRDWTETIRPTVTQSYCCDDDDDVGSFDDEMLLSSSSPPALCSLCIILERGGEPRGQIWRDSRFYIYGFFVGKYPTECGKYPHFVLMVAVVEFDGRMTYRRKDHRHALLLVPYFCL